ncbi:hypothetical protein BH24DEI2_BH24DEI2_07610 [soil metagenome]
MTTNPNASHDRALVEEASQTSSWFADKSDDWLQYIDTKGALSERMRDSATREVNLTKALAVADVRVLVEAHYPGAGVNLGLSKQRVKAVWRGGEGLNVVLDARGLHDFVTGESYGVLSFLTQVVGLSIDAAKDELLNRAGYSATRPQYVKAATAATQFSAAPKEPSEADLRREAWLERQFEEAAALHRQGNLSGVSGYFERKGVSAALFRHHVRGQAVYARDDFGNFLQVPIMTFSGETTGYQRLYNHACLQRKYDTEPRDKDFIGSTRGGFVALVPKEVGVLPEDGAALGRLLRQGYSLDLCEGIATGMSICQALPRSIMLCALTAGNLVPVVEALREHYGYLGARPHWFARRGRLDVTIWADDDRWSKNDVGKKVPIPKALEPNAGREKALQAADRGEASVCFPVFDKRHWPQLPTDFNDLHRLYGVEAVRRARR